MSDLEATKFDDELLSAYLDDELAPEERARVEEHLASDPRARQLLEELKTVSGAVKELPLATLDTDLRESVLRRAERAMLIPGGRASARGFTDVIRKLPFGRSKRAWAWAGMALAAGLLLMFFEREPGRNQGLSGAVAQRERLPAHEVRSAPQRSVADQVAEVATAPLAAPKSAPVAESIAERKGGGVGSGVGGSAAVVGRSAAEVADGEDLLVVHVNVKPDALRSRAIDAVLARNQIEVEQPAESELDKSKLADAPREAQKVDVLLLEAAPGQIMSTLAEMDADHANYLGIAVDDEMAASQRARAAERPDYDFKQHSRGSVPLQQKLEVAPNRNYYYNTDRGPIEIERNVRQEVELRQKLSSADELRESVQSRAVRFEPQTANRTDALDRTLAKEQSGQLSASAALPAASPAPAAAAERNYGGDMKLGFARRASQKLATKAEMLQVLFVLTAGDESAAAKPAASPPPSTSQSVEEGLKKDDR